MGAGPQHQALLPSADTPKPWETVVAATYTNLKSVPVLCSRTETSTGTRRRWIAPGNAVVVDEVEEKGGGGGEEMAEYLKRLSKVNGRGWGTGMELQRLYSVEGFLSKIKLYR